MYFNDFLNDRTLTRITMTYKIPEETRHIISKHLNLLAIELCVIVSMLTYLAFYIDGRLLHFKVLVKNGDEIN